MLVEFNPGKFLHHGPEVMVTFEPGDIVTITKEHSSKQGTEATVLDPDYSDASVSHMIQVQQMDESIAVYHPHELNNRQDPHELARTTSRSSALVDVEDVYAYIGDNDVQNSETQRAAAASLSREESQKR